MQFFSEPAGAESSFSSWTLVVPAVTVGNVAQLACDLLLLNSKASRVGYLQHDALLDCVGNDPLGDASGAATALEVFAVKEKRIAIVQQRALVVLGKQRKFSTAFVDWAAQAGFANVLVISGIEAQRAEQIGEGVFRYISTAAGGADEKAEKLGWRQLEDRVLFGVPIDEARVPPWPLFQAASAKGLPCLALLVFCTEGDNVPEAVDMTFMADKLLGVLPPAVAAAAGTRAPGSAGQLQMPASWKTILYGSIDVDAAACY